MPCTAQTSDVRELDYRTNDGIEVRLLWNRLADSVSVSVQDRRYGESFEFDVAATDAIDAFHHPYAYASNDPDTPSRPVERSRASSPRREEER